MRGNYQIKSNPKGSFPGSLNSTAKQRTANSGFTVKIAMICVFMLTLLMPTSQGQGIPVDMTELSLEDLMNIEVTSVSKKAEKLSRAAAAIYVITRENIRRSGVTSIPEALRMVPGVQVAQIDVNKWAVTSRGFNGYFANKLLVLIDGRSVYAPLFSGVHWNVQDVLLEDIERIEIIRGPGATLWGANAVNGVINIITKNAGDTQGVYMKTGGGSKEKGFVSFRYGDKFGDEFFYRVYAKYFNRDNSVDSSGLKAADDWDVLRAGFRFDWKYSDQNSLTMHGDVYDGNAGVTYIFPAITPPYFEKYNDKTNIAGGNILTGWTHLFSSSSDITLQFYFDRTEYKDAFYSENRNTFDFEIQHRFEPFKQMEMIWGLSHRLTKGVHDSTSYAWPDSNRTDNLFSSFVQGKIALYENLLHLIVGSKFEHNDYTGFEIQPNGRIIWFPHERHTIWAAVSRAVRTPSGVEDYGHIRALIVPPGTPDNPSPLPVLLILTGNQQFVSEILTAHEVGYRVWPTDRISVDLAMFYNDYNKLRSLKWGMPVPDAIPPSYLLSSVNFNNDLKGETYGVEMTIDWRTRDWLHLQAAYTHLQIQLRMKEGLKDTISEGVERNSPQHQLSLRTTIDLAKDLEFDARVRYVDNLPHLKIESFVEFDIRLGWTLCKYLELSIAVQNLISNRHSEFMSELNNLYTQVERSVYGQATWRF